MTRYQKLLQLIIAKMHHILSLVLPINKSQADIYFHRLWSYIARLLVPISDLEIHNGLWDKFDEYVKLEEDRIASNLGRINYCIDGPSTVSIISGDGRMETVQCHQITF